MAAPQDILAATATYLQGVMGSSLASATGYAQAYSDFAPQQNPDGSPVSQPYAVIEDGPETYSAQSSTTGKTQVDVIADGILRVWFYATTKAQARALGLQGVLLLTDTKVQLTPADATCFTLLPVRAESFTPKPEDPGVSEPTVFARIVTVNYKQEFVE